MKRRVLITVFSALSIVLSAGGCSSGSPKTQNGNSSNAFRTPYEYSASWDETMEDIEMLYVHSNFNVTANYLLWDKVGTLEFENYMKLIKSFSGDGSNGDIEKFYRYQKMFYTAWDINWDEDKLLSYFDLYNYHEETGPTLVEDIKLKISQLSKENGKDKSESIDVLTDYYIAARNLFELGLKPSGTLDEYVAKADKLRKEAEDLKIKSEIKK